MKIGANDPCPCGSGLKYKKCCRNRTDLSEIPTQDKSILAEVYPENPDLEWEPLHWRGGVDRYLSLAESQKILKPSHLRFLYQVEVLTEEHTDPISWREGLRRVEQIPEMDMYRLHGVLQLKAKLLRRLGREMEANLLQMEHLFRFEQEELWMEDGHVVLYRLVPESDMDADEKKRWLDRLYRLCQRSNLLIPNLIWAYLNAPTEEVDIDALLVMYRRGMAWERWRLFPTLLPVWLPIIVRVWVAILPWLWKHGHLKAAQFFLNVFPRFPWHLWPEEKLPDQLIEVVCHTFLSMQRWDTLQSWLESMQTSSANQALIWTYLGGIAERQGQLQRTTKAYREALRFPDQLSSDVILSFVIHFRESKLWSDMEKALVFLEQDDRISVLRCRFFCYLMQQQHEPALLAIERICHKTPDDLKMWVYRWFLLESMQREDQLADELLNILEQESGSEKSKIARIFLGLHDVRHYRFEAGYQRLDGVTQADVTGAVWEGNELWARVLDARGQCAYRLGDDQTACPWFQLALEAEPSEWRYHQVLRSYIVQEQFEQAEVFAAKAYDAYPNSRYLAYDRYVLAIQKQRWQDAWDCLQVLTLDFFRESQSVEDGLFFFVQALVYLQRWWDAFLFCEEHLSSFLEDPELSVIRKELIQDIEQQYKSMQEELGQRDQKIARLERKHQALFSTLEQTRSKHDALRQSFLQQEHLHRQWKQREEQQKDQWSSPQPKQESTLRGTLAGWQQDRADLFSGLSLEKQDVLRSAEYLWLQLAEHPQQDHSPVILQQSRVLEGLVNRKLIDPLVRIALAQGGALHQFPAVAVGSIRPEQNRLSLGDMANLLFNRREYTEPDGSVSVEVNPQSSPQHRDWLQQLWLELGLDESNPQEKEWINKLPKQLRDLARIRNRASHAGAPLSREVAGQVRTWVLGERSGQGLLAWLLQIRAPSEPSTEV